MNDDMRKQMAVDFSKGKIALENMTEEQQIAVFGHVLRKHYGPGDHPDGSSQDVHAGGRAKANRMDTEAEIRAKASADRKAKRGKNWKQKREAAVADVVSGNEGEGGYGMESVQEKVNREDSFLLATDHLKDGSHRIDSDTLSREQFMAVLKDNNFKQTTPHDPVYRGKLQSGAKIEILVMPETSAGDKKFFDVHVKRL